MFGLAMMSSPSSMRRPISSIVSSMVPRSSPSSPKRTELPTRIPWDLMVLRASRTLLTHASGLRRSRFLPTFRMTCWAMLSIPM